MQSCMAPSVKCWTSARGFECTAVGANTFSRSLTFSVGNAGTFCLTSVCTWSILMCLCESDETLTRPLCCWCCIKVQSEDKCCWCKCTSLAEFCVVVDDASPSHRGDDVTVVMMSRWQNICPPPHCVWRTVRTHAGDLNLIQRRGVFLITTLLLILHVEAEITIHLLIRIWCVCVCARELSLLDYWNEDILETQ